MCERVRVCSSLYGREYVGQHVVSGVQLHLLFLIMIFFLQNFRHEKRSVGAAAANPTC